MDAFLKVAVTLISTLITNVCFSASQPDWCRNKLNAAEQVICNNPEIWDLEEQNRQLYFYLYKTEQARKENKTNAISWLRYRNKRCIISVSACIQEYRNRVNFLSDLVSNKQNNPKRNIPSLEKRIEKLEKKVEPLDIKEDGGVTIVTPKG